MPHFSKILWGDGLDVTEEGNGVIRVDGSGGATGETGPPGAAGPAGPAGPPGVDAPTYVFSQPTPAASWTITHSLGQYPSVSVVDTGGSVVLPDVHYDSADALTVTFDSPTSGKAYLN